MNSKIIIIDQSLKFRKRHKHRFRKKGEQNKQAKRQKKKKSQINPKKCMARHFKVE